MTIDVDPDWWKTLFDEVYLMTDARSIGDEVITRQEIDIFTSLVPMQPHDRILDLCGGQGRHALELCRRGFRDCTVLDYSQSLIDIGKREAVDQCRSVQFAQGDARHTDLPPETLDHVLLLGNSLGYITEPDADLQILQRVCACSNHTAGCCWMSLMAPPHARHWPLLPGMKSATTWSFAGSGKSPRAVSAPGRWC